jgi:hypothetical protein
MSGLNTREAFSKSKALLPNYRRANPTLLHETQLRQGFVGQSDDDDYKDENESKLRNAITYSNWDTGIRRPVSRQERSPLSAFERSSVSFSVYESASALACAVGDIFFQVFWSISTILAGSVLATRSVS